MSARRFVVHLGWDRLGRPRNKWFTVLADARLFCQRISARTGVILSIEERDQ